ncbi:MAG: transcription elongation factor GreA [Christensenellales bacterium]
MSKTFLTPQGKKELEEKLEYYKTIKRQEISKAIGEAREFGDLSENAEYDAAKNEQAMIEHEILEIEAKLRNSVVIDKNKIDTSKVSIGCIVKIYDEDFDEEVEYQIIGSTESNPQKGLISNESPVGKALLNSRIGDVVSVETPGGVSNLKVLEIRA